MTCCRVDGGHFFRGVSVKVEKDVVIINGKLCKAYEYWCTTCKQLRLSCVATDKCGNCGSTKIIKGDIGTLKKE